MHKHSIDEPQLCPASLQAGSLVRSRAFGEGGMGGLGGDGGSYRQPLDTVLPNK